MNSWQAALRTALTVYVDETPNAEHLRSMVHWLSHGELAPQDNVPSLDEPTRYRDLGRIAEGGMGEVRRVLDTRLDRVVVQKVLKADRPNLAPMFWVEACVTARLEHPSIVPVHDFGMLEDGRPFFVMKEIRGRTLSSIISELHEQGSTTWSATEDGWTLRRCVDALARACDALALAHDSSVVHRDLKPDNVMLGPFGEVYVLDWGVAKLTHPDESGQKFDAGAMVRTAHGTVVGTPGYMAPEQIHGDPDGLDGRADVYSLGAILFLLVTGQPLVAIEENIESMLANAFRGVDLAERFSRLERFIAPELQSICLRATQRKPEERFASARELHDALQGYLEGGRDIEMRRQMAQRQVEHAHKLAAQALDFGATAEGHGEAMQALGRVIALDPTHEPTLDWIARLMIEPVGEPPPEFLEHLQKQRDDLNMLKAKNGAWAVTGLGLVLGAGMLSLGVRDWSTFTLIVAPLLGVALSNLVALRLQRPPKLLGFVPMVGVLLATLGISRLFGSLILLPSVLVLAVAAFALNPGKTARRVFTLFALALLIGPVVLEFAGVLEPAYSFVGGLMRVHPGATDLPQIPVLALLLGGNAAALIAALRLMGDVGDTLDSANTNLQLFSWRLQSMLPSKGAANRMRAQSTVIQPGDRL